MKYLIGAAALLAATASADFCSDGSSEYLGNYYCQEVNAITYTGVGGSGSYNRVTSMDSGTGTCSSTPQGYSGSLSPLDEEVSIHIRGPVSLLQFASYAPGQASTKKSRRSEHARRHVHHHAHRLEERQAEVTATIDGVVVSWVNDYTGVSPTPAPDSSAPATEDSSEGSSPASAAPASYSEPPSSGSSSGGWGRTGYYNAQQQQAEDVVFLNHYGGSGSGVFDYTFGNSLSYASSDGCEGSSSKQTLADTTLPSDAEVVIMTDTECGANGGSCGYYRPGTVAYHGFDGAQKAFFFEFEMPDVGGTAASIYDPVNMPALWLLNAQIPRTLQYGNAECSCWESGCGEFDIFEILSPGYNKAKSTLHGNIAGGSSDWFQRPESGSIKVAVVMSNDNIHVKVLDDSVNFDRTVDSHLINHIVSSTMTQNQSKLVSLFSLAGATPGR